MTRMSKTERIARDGLMKSLIALNRDPWIVRALAEEVPDAWRTLEHDLDVTEKKVKVTLYLDTSVAKFYRAMGQGYQARINRLLATYAQMHIAPDLHNAEENRFTLYVKQGLCLHADELRSEPRAARMLFPKIVLAKEAETPSYSLFIYLPIYFIMFYFIFFSDSLEFLNVSEFIVETLLNL